MTIWAFLLVFLVPGALTSVQASCTDSYGAPRLERSYWIHASLGANLSKGYWAENARPNSGVPTRTEIRNAARLLTGHYAANCLHLVYHNEIPIRDLGRIFRDWRSACPEDVELVPALVLKRYDKAQGDVFSEPEFARLCDLLKSTGFRKVAVYDVLPNRDASKWIARLAEAFPGGLVRVGIQPEEKIAEPFAAAVQDTWSGLCWGKTNADWESPGLGRDALRSWVKARNAEAKPVAWDLIAVAWDYVPTARGDYPGYDDSARNMPLPAGRNRLAAREILVTASRKVLAGFSSDFVILEWNSRHANHDGRENSIYQVLRRGEAYKGYYSAPLEEIAGIYSGLRSGRLPCR